MTALLVVDIGNTTTKVGLWNGASVVSVAVTPTDEPETIPGTVARAAAGAGLDDTSRLDVALCSVVPRAQDIWLDWCARRGRAPFVLHGDTPSPLTNRYRTPGRLGPDRLAAAVAAEHRLGAPVIVATCGTALVVDAVSPSREYLGGAIWVGLGTGLAALAEHTMGLPHVLLEVPATSIGGDTASSLQAGAIFGAAALIEGLAARMRDYLGADTPLALAGGDAETLSPHLRLAHECAPQLVLEGLGLIWEHSRQ